MWYCEGANAVGISYGTECEEDNGAIGCKRWSSICCSVIKEEGLSSRAMAKSYDAGSRGCKNAESS